MKTRYKKLHDQLIKESLNYQIAYRIVKQLGKRLRKKDLQFVIDLTNGINKAAFLHQ